MLRTSRTLAELVIALVCLSCAEQPVAPARNTIALKAPIFDILAFDATLPTTTESPAATLALPTYSNPIIVRVEIHRTIGTTRIAVADGSLQIHIFDASYNYLLSLQGL